MAWRLSIVAALAVYAYLAIRRTYPPAEPPFSAYCHEVVVVVSARVDLRDVKVVDAHGRVYCTFPSIKAGAEKLCSVGNATAYLVEAGDFSGVVLCFRPVPVTPVGINLKGSFYPHPCSGWRDKELSLGLSTRGARGRRWP